MSSTYFSNFRRKNMAALSRCLVGSGLSIRDSRTSLSHDIYGRRPIQSPHLTSLNGKPLLVRATMNEKPNEERRGFLKLLLGGAGLVTPALLGNGIARADDQGVSNSRMSYSRFLEYLDKGRVMKVDLYENGTIAIVEAVSPELGNQVQRVRVQLPGLSQELLQKLREENIDFAAHNAQEDSGSLLFKLIGNLASL